MLKERLSCFILILFLFLPSLLSADEPPRLAVIPFQAAGVSQSEADAFTTLFETAAVNTMAFEIIEQTLADAILEAQAYSLGGCTDESCAVEIGKLLAAEQIVLGTVSKLGEMYIVTAKIIDVESGKNLKAGRVDGMSLEAMAGRVESLALTLAGLGGTPGGIGSGTEALEAEKKELKKELRSLRAVALNRPLGYGAAAVAGGCFLGSAITLIQAGIEKTSYDGSTDSMELLSLRGQIETFENRFAQFTMAGIATGALSAIFFNLPRPDVAADARRKAVVERLLEIDRQITILEGGAK